ncbi:MAG: hypothetical protein IKO47_08765 [Ruminococcus sp.]|nr:hypothetical protein [Ruminococcus sp.]
MSKEWFMDYAAHRLRLIILEQERLEMRYCHLSDGARGDMAVSIIDDLYDIIHA